jgi:transposase
MARSFGVPQDDNRMARHCLTDRALAIGIERCVGKLKDMRRICTRYEKLARNYLAMLTLGMTVLYLRVLT